MKNQTSIRHFKGLNIYTNLKPIIYYYKHIYTVRDNLQTAPASYSVLSILIQMTASKLQNKSAHLDVTAVEDEFYVFAKTYLSRPTSRRDTYED